MFKLKKNNNPFKEMELSGFCMQIALLFKAAIPIYDGLSVMAEDAGTEEEKRILTEMSDKVRIGAPFSQAVKEAGCFPEYMVEMIILGEQTGTLDGTLEELADYYEKEYRLMTNLKKCLTYPVMMVSMLLVILFVLFVKIMPIFLDVYESLGATMSPITMTAIHAGGFLSGTALVLLLILLVLFLIIKIFGNWKKQPVFIEKIFRYINTRSKISRMSALRRFCSTIAVTLRCGLNLEDGLNMAERLTDHPTISMSVKKSKEMILEGSSFYDAVKESGLFNGFDLQLIKVAGKAGQTESALQRLSEDYDQKTEDTIDSMMSHLEPIIVSILAVAVGLVLISVMLPLVGILSAIG